MILQPCRIARIWVSIPDFVWYSLGQNQRLALPPNFESGTLLSLPLPFLPAFSLQSVGPTQNMYEPSGESRIVMTDTERSC
jgi:hypothetical protein